MCHAYFGRIEGLDTLVKLRELNLSSNNIAVVEGLQHLKKLEVLNLSANKVRFPPMGFNLILCR
jgi:Leucine-rich repeat (LRR) protein